jgi:hypothetical protein
MTTLCPRCDNQGLIYKAKILNLGIILNICDECDACWPENQKVTINNFKDLTIFLEEHNLMYQYTEIIDLGYVESTPDERQQTFFNVPRKAIISLIDEAWVMKDAHLINDPGAYVINMKRVIGTDQESAIKIIVKPGTSEIKTAYPIKI